MPETLVTFVDRQLYASDLLATFEQRVNDLAKDYADGTIGIGDWQIEMRDELRQMNAMMLITATGGDKDNVDSADWLKLGSELRSQDKFLEGFAHDIVDNDMSEEAIAARARMYVRATQATYWRQAADELGIELPAVPGDGDSECVTNCNCYWSFDYEYDDDGNIVAVLATWNLGENDKHCPTCSQHAEEWKPLRIPVSNDKGEAE